MPQTITQVATPTPGLDYEKFGKGKPWLLNH